MTEPRALAAVPSPSQHDGPPVDDPAERAVLGSCLLSAAAMGEVGALVRAAHFWRPAHGLLWQAMLDLHGEGSAVDPVTVVGRLTRDGQLANVGGASYVHELVAGVPTAANVGWYAANVVDVWARRRLLPVAHRLAELAYVPGRLSATEILSRGRRVLEVDTSGLGVFDRLGSGLPTAIESAAGETAEDTAMIVPTGLADLDAKLQGGLRGGQLVVIAARPAVGKSLLLLDVARHCALVRGLPAFVASLEMTRAELLERSMAAVARVPLTRIRTGTCTADDLVRLVDRQGDMEGMPLLVDDSGSWTISRLVARARQAKAEHPTLAMVCVDYLQLVTGELAKGRREQTREQEVAAVTRGLKLLAKELGIPVVVACQLNRAAHHRRPSLTDLRESGAIEMDADTVIFLHRDREDGPHGDMLDEVELLVAKQRGGPTGRVTALVQGQYGRITGLYSGAA